MSNSLEDDSVDIELIEKYRKGELVGAALTDFLQRQKADRDFANKIRSYSEIIDGIEYYGGQEEFAETINEWEREIKGGTRELRINDDRDSTLNESKGVIPINRNRVLLWGSAIAASLLLLIAFLTFRDDSPRHLADTYIQENLTTLSTSMSGDTDQLAEGVSAFNNQDYTQAETIFRSLSTNDDLAPETTKYLGITYLSTGEYDRAIEQFTKLISFTNLYANPGKFYLAIAFMKRSAQGDKEQARRLLEEVVKEKLPGNKEASDWLAQMD